MRFDPKGNPMEASVLTFEYSNEGESWVAECLEMGTVAEADTLEEVQKDIIEAVELQLDSMEEMGFMDGFLREHGIRTFLIERPSQPSFERPSWSMPVVSGPR